MSDIFLFKLEGWPHSISYKGDHPDHHIYTFYDNDDNIVSMHYVPKIGERIMNNEREYSNSSNEYFAAIRNEDATCIVRWNKKEAYFTLEDGAGDYVVVFKDMINDIVSELVKLKSLMEKEEERPRTQHKF